MKSMKTLAPILLVLLTVFSAYSLISGATEKSTEFKGHIEAARELAVEGIVVDAAVEYDDAIEMKPSIELYLEKGEMFKKNKMNGSAISLGEVMLAKYPKDSRAYDFIIGCYLDDNNYKDCYDILDTAEKRKLSSEIISKAQKELQYKFELDYKGYEDVADYSDGYCAVKKKEYWGYVNESGSQITDFVLLNAGMFSSDLACITDSENNVFYIDSQGNRKKNIPSEIGALQVGAFSDKIAAIKTAEGFAYYDEDFKKVAGNYEFAGTFSEEIAGIQDGQGWYLINTSGKKLNETPYQGVAVDANGKAFKNGRAFVKKDGKYIMVNSKTEQIGDQLFEDAKPFGSGGLAAVKLSGKWGFVNSEGTIVIKPQYVDALSFEYGLAAVSNGEKWGYINENGETAIEFSFDGCKSFNKSGRTFILDGNSWMMIKLLAKNH